MADRQDTFFDWLLIIVPLLFLSFYYWNYWRGIKTRGVMISSFSQPNPGRIMILLCMGIVLILAGLALVPPVQARQLYFPFILIGCFLPQAWGRIQFHENGVWCLFQLIGWTRFHSYTWPEGGNLALRYGRKITPMVLKVSESDRPAIEALLAEKIQRAPGQV